MQMSGRVNSPRRVQKMCRCGTQGPVLVVDSTVLGYWLYSDVRCLFQPKWFSLFMCITQKHKIVVHREKLKLLTFIILKKQNLSPLQGIPASALPYINYWLIHSTGWVKSRKVCATYIFRMISHSEKKNQNISMNCLIWESPLCKDVLWWYVRVWCLLKNNKLWIQPFTRFLSWSWMEKTSKLGPWFIAVECNPKIEINYSVSM